MKTMIGIIGGSGLYDLPNLNDASWHKVDTPWGLPSDEILVGSIFGIPVAFLPRHARGHLISPSEIPFLANIAALKKLGVTDILSVSSCGSLKEEMAPGDFILVDQFIDRTFRRRNSFFETGCVAHVSMATPTCNRLSNQLYSLRNEIGCRLERGGTYLAMEGPQFSTLAESLLYKDIYKCEIIGMTNMPEAKLAREAEICYQPIAMITDFDCWHSEYDNVEVTDILKMVETNVDNVKKLLLKFLEACEPVKDPCSEGCDRALEHAIITNRDKIDTELASRLRVIADRVL